MYSFVKKNHRVLFFASWFILNLIQAYFTELLDDEAYYWVYSRFPAWGLINTILYTYFCFFWWDLYAEGSLNFYYTVMSVYGWVIWAQRNKETHEKKVRITASSYREWAVAAIFFFVAWIILYFVLRQFTDSTVPLGDSFASASAYTGMWLMARKKLENWLWWILTNIASIPLYFYKGAVFTSVQYLVFLVLAIMGYITWRKKIADAA